MSDEKGFRDDGEGLEEFMEDILIKCPRCNGCAHYKIIGEPRSDATGHRIARAYFYSKRFANPAPGRITCPKCGFTKVIEDDKGELEGFLQTPCCGHTLWALNEKHLDFLEGFLGPTLRKRKPYEHHSITANLPGWVKEKKNRDDVEKGLKKLRTMLEDCR